MSFPLTENLFLVLSKISDERENLGLEDPKKMSDLLNQILRMRNDAKPEFDRESSRLHDLETMQAETNKRLLALEKKHLDSVDGMANLKGREPITTRTIEGMGVEIRDQAEDWRKQLKEATDDLCEQIDEVKLTLAMHLSPDIEIGEAELRRRVLRKLQGIMGRDIGQESFNAAANADDQWAAFLNRQNFVDAKLEWIWDRHHKLSKDMTKTEKRNELIHRMSTQRLFAAALLKKEDEEDETYSRLAATYRELFRWTNGCSIADAAEELRNSQE